MTAFTPLEQALAAYGRRTDHYREATAEEQQSAIDDVVALGETGVFSCRHIGEITGVPEPVVVGVTNKRDKSGGRFSAQTLPLIHQVWLEYAQSGNADKAAIRTIINLGVSTNFLSKLTEIPQRSIARWAKNGD